MKKMKKTLRADELEPRSAPFTAGPIDRTDVPGSGGYDTPHEDPPPRWRDDAFGDRRLQARTDFLEVKAPASRP